MKGTVKEITEALNKKGIKIDNINVNGYIKTLLAMGKARNVGFGDKPARGRAPVVYDVDSEA